MRPDLADCLKTLDVAPGVSAAEIQQAYRDLVKVWHPDRFGDQPRLRQKAEGKLKEINLAYERLRTCDAHLGEPARPNRSNAKATPNEWRSWQSTPPRQQSDWSAPPPPPEPVFTRRPSTKISGWWAFALVLSVTCAIVVFHQLLVAVPSGIALFAAIRTWRDCKRAAPIHFLKILAAATRWITKHLGLLILFLLSLIATDTNSRAASSDTGRM